MATGFAVAVKIVDFATGPLANINRSIVNLEKSAKQVARQGGLFEARDALKKIRDQAESVGDSLAKVFTPLGALTAAGSIGGLAALSERFARLGSEIGRTSSTLGLNTTDLQKWRGAADLAGVGADAMTGSIAGLAQGIYLTRNGLDPNMFRVAQRWGLDINRGTTDAEKGLNVLLQVARKFRTDPSLRGNTQAQKTLAEQLHIDPRMLWLMQQGEQKMREFAELSRQHGYLTDQQITRSMELQFAYNGLTQSVGSFTNAVAAEMSKWMTPTIKGFSDWIDKLRKSPGAMKAVEVGAETLAGVFGVTMVAGVAKLIARLNMFWALPAIKFLLSPAGAGLAAILGLTSHGFGQFMPGRLPRHGSEESFRQHANPAPQPDWFGRQFNRAWDWLHLPHHIGAQGRARIGEATDAYIRKGWTPAQAAGIAANQYRESGLINKTGDSGLAQGFGQWHPDRQANFERLFHHPISQATAQEQYEFTDYELRRGTERLAGLLLKNAKTGAQAGGILSKYYERPRDVEGEANARAALGKQIEGWGRQPTAPAAGGGPAGAMTLPDVNVTAPRGARMPTAAEPLGGGGAGPQSFNIETGNSRHEVYIDVRGPKGMRTGLAKAEGPAEVAVRTHYSMDDLS